LQEGNGVFPNPAGDQSPTLLRIFSSRFTSRNNSVHFSQSSTYLVLPRRESVTDILYRIELVFTPSKVHGSAPQDQNRKYHSPNLSYRTFLARYEYSCNMWFKSLTFRTWYFSCLAYYN